MASDLVLHRLSKYILRDSRIYRINLVYHDTAVQSELARKVNSLKWKRILPLFRRELPSIKARVVKEVTACIRVMSGCHMFLFSLKQAVKPV